MDYSTVVVDAPDCLYSDPVYEARRSYARYRDFPVSSVTFVGKTEDGRIILRYPNRRRTLHAGFGRR